MNFRIEPMREEHVRDTVALEEECNLNSRGELSYYKALQDNRSVLFVLLDIVPAPSPPIFVAFFSGLMVVDEIQIDNLAVASNYRRMGVGTLLLFSVIKFAREKGMSGLVLEVRSANQAALNLYQQAGFSIIGRRKNYYQCPTDDALIMGLKLEITH